MPDQDSDSDIPTPIQGFPTPRTRSTTYSNHSLPASRRPSEHGLNAISSSSEFSTSEFPTPHPSRAPVNSYFPRSLSRNTPTTANRPSIAHTNSTSSIPTISEPVTPTPRPNFTGRPRSPSTLDCPNPSGPAHYQQLPTTNSFQTRFHLPKRSVTVPILPTIFSAESTPATSTSDSSSSCREKSPTPSIDGRDKSECANSAGLDRAKLARLLDKFDPRSENMTELWPIQHHREMIRTMFLDNIMYATARLHSHKWILGAKNKDYKSLAGKERWDLIHDDLNKYTQAIRDYEYWLTSFMQQLELDPVDLPPRFQSWGRNLAMMELAAHPDTRSLFSSEEHDLLKEWVWDHLALCHNWSQTNQIFRFHRLQREAKSKARKGLISRILMASFGGATLIVPMLIMVLDSRQTTTLVTTSVCTLGIGLILAFWMTHSEPKDIIAATAAYAAVLVVFVGTGSEGRFEHQHAKLS